MRREKKNRVAGDGIAKAAAIRVMGVGGDAQLISGHIMFVSAKVC